MWLSLLLSTVVVIFVYKIMQRLVVALPLSRFSKEPTGAIRRHTANTYLYIIGMLLSQGTLYEIYCPNVYIIIDVLKYCHHRRALCFKKHNLSHCGWRLVFRNFRPSAILHITSIHLHHRTEQSATHRVN